MQINIHITDLIDTLTDVKIDVKILELSLVQGRRFKKILQYCPKNLKIERRAVFWRDFVRCVNLFTFDARSK